MTSSSVPGRPKAALKKEELEKIAKQLKKKLSKASITAKQSLSPTAIKNTSSSVPKSSPLKSYITKKQYGSSPSNNSLINSSPNTLCSPNGKSPTHLRTPAAIYLSSSPLKNMAADSNEHDETMDSPTKRRKNSPRKDGKGPQMVLEEIQRPNTPSGAGLKPSLELTAADAEKKKLEQTTPTLTKREIHGSPSNNPNILLQTPKQSRPTSNGGAYNDNEGADLLMYLATSPSPAPYFSNTPRPINPTSQIHPSLSSGPNSSGSLSLSHKHTSSAGSQSSFIAPPPPVTPKRHSNNSTRTPQNRLTPSMNLFNSLNNANGLPSSGLTLTPTGFNMNDYVNFFTPSPGGALNKNLLRTPEFNNLLNGHANGVSDAAAAAAGRPKVDGKMLNFNKVQFGNSSHGGGDNKE
ncbi:uncharacterized protein RJT20DRAFT_133584 [Scheffersomyces xylosifermentans]|uniref:uncharacterized protein n=1 Tax=Scheffersomyces xylosifermentans TaxID=1304137 RepID=UPI00315D0BF9